MEQLNLFASEERESRKDKRPPPRTPRERLGALLEADLDFQGAKTGYASHSWHAFAAKFPPQLPRHFIQGLTEPGDVVLDPMAGSGTAVVEALLLRRIGIGVDLDPLAVQIAQVKLTHLPSSKLLGAARRVLSKTRRLLEEGEAITRRLHAFDTPTREFIEYWFLPATQRELMALSMAIQEEPDAKARRFLRLVFSSTIVTKSGGVSLARDLAHSRPHRDLAKRPRSALEAFQVRLGKAMQGMESLSRGGQAIILHGNARHLPLADNTVHLVVTSPPYANAIDYMRAHKFSLVWMGKRIPDLSRWRGRYIGAERLGDFEPPPFPTATQQVIQTLAERDARRARVLGKYFFEMQQVLGEMHRVLRPGAAAVIVVGTSTMRGMNVQTHLCLAELAEEVGFDLVRIVERGIDRDRRMMPARWGAKTTQIEQRMHHEYVIGLLKPEEG